MPQNYLDWWVGKCVLQAAVPDWASAEKNATQRGTSSILSHHEPSSAITRGLRSLDTPPAKVVDSIPDSLPRLAAATNLVLALDTYYVTLRPQPISAALDWLRRTWIATWPAAEDTKECGCSSEPGNVLRSTYSVQSPAVDDWRM